MVLMLLMLMIVFVSASRVPRLPDIHADAMSAVVDTPHEVGSTMSARPLSSPRHPFADDDRSASLSAETVSPIAYLTRPTLGDRRGSTLPTRVAVACDGDHLLARSPAPEHRPPGVMMAGTRGIALCPLYPGNPGTRTPTARRHDGRDPLDERSASSPPRLSGPLKLV